MISEQSLIILFAQIAQLVEQWTENPCVAGSIPALGIFLKKKNKKKKTLDNIIYLRYTKRVRKNE